MPELTRLYILNSHSLLYVNYGSIKLPKMDQWRWIQKEDRKLTRRSPNISLLLSSKMMAKPK